MHEDYKVHNIMTIVHKVLSLKYHDLFYDLWSLYMSLDTADTRKVFGRKVKENNIGKKAILTQSLFFLYLFFKEHILHIA